MGGEDEAMTTDELLIRVDPSYLSDDVWILIPPKFWGHPLLAEAIKKAVAMTFEKPKESIADH